MKSLREHLLEKNRRAEPRLDVLRVRAVAIAAGRGERRGVLPILRLFWGELVEPCRGAWACLTAAWVVLLAVHAATWAREAPGALSPREAEAVLACWRERRRAMEALAASEPQPPRRLSEEDAGLSEKMQRDDLAVRKTSSFSPI